MRFDVPSPRVNCALEPVADRHDVASEKRAAGWSWNGQEREGREREREGERERARSVNWRTERNREVPSVANNQRLK